MREPVASAEVGASTISLHEGPLAERPYELCAMESSATGFLHIVRIGGDLDLVNAVYRIAFAPLDGSLRTRRPQREGSTRSLTSCGRPVSRFWRSNGRGRLSRSAGFTPSRVSL